VTQKDLKISIIVPRYNGQAVKWGYLERGKRKARTLSKLKTKMERAEETD